MIESPGKGAARSYVGARGPFQLMPAVARRFGLKVSKYHDDRLDMNKAGMAAARLINTGCVPYIRKFLDEKAYRIRNMIFGSGFWCYTLIMPVPVMSVVLSMHSTPRPAACSCLSKSGKQPVVALK